MNIKSHSTSFGSVYFKREKVLVNMKKLIDDKKPIPYFYFYEGDVKKDGKPDVYYNSEKVCESETAKNISDKAYVKLSEHYNDLIYLLEEIKPSRLERYNPCSKKPIAMLYKEKERFQKEFLKKITLLKNRNME